jgi:2-amino-4-hydroxy-6-hydroxymethyldihydropteridine diphosphokinase
MVSVLLALGSNQGDRQQHLADAVSLIGSRCHGRIVAVSEWQETDPVGGPPGQSPFLNGALILESPWTLEKLWGHLSEIETRLGRTREMRWASRTIDIDILLSHPEHSETETSTFSLVLPHPRMMVRDFVLSPACQIAGAWIHPILGRTLASIRDQLRMDHLPVLVVPGDEGVAEKSQSLVERVFPEARCVPILAPAPLSQKWDPLKGVAQPTRSATHDPLEFGLESASHRPEVVLLTDISAIMKAPPMSARGAVVLEPWQDDASRVLWRHMSPASLSLARASYCPFTRMDLDSESANEQLRACVQGIAARS